LFLRTKFLVINLVILVVDYNPTIPTTMQHKNNELQNKYTETFNQLNAAQQKAVNTIDGPVMVIAGPGTGKTQI
jgi:hypothetical protein